MSNSPATTTRGPNAGGAPRGTGKVAPSAGVRRRRELRYALVAGALLALVLSLGLLLATTMPSSHVAAVSQPKSGGPFGTETRTGSIVLESADGRCRQLSFDNDTGRVAELTRSCEKDSVRLDDKGVPVPMGTVRRLDAISKSFSKQ